MQTADVTFRSKMNGRNAVDFLDVLSPQQCVVEGNVHWEAQKPNDHADYSFWSLHEIIWFVIVLAKALLKPLVSKQVMMLFLDLMMSTTSIKWPHHHPPRHPPLRHPCCPPVHARHTPIGWVVPLCYLFILMATWVTMDSSF